MYKLTENELVSLLVENSEKGSKDEMHNAYGVFVNQAKSLNQSDNDSSIIFRSLNSTCIEFLIIHLATFGEYHCTPLFILLCFAVFCFHPNALE